MKNKIIYQFKNSILKTKLEIKFKVIQNFSYYKQNKTVLYNNKYFNQEKEKKLIVLAIFRIYTN